MDLPEAIQKLVSELGDSLIDALADDPACHALALRIQEHGYDLCLVLEATQIIRSEDGEAGWSEDDARVLQDFRIALD